MFGCCMDVALSTAKIIIVLQLMLVCAECLMIDRRRSTSDDARQPVVYRLVICLSHTGLAAGCIVRICDTEEDKMGNEVFRVLTTN